MKTLDRLVYLSKMLNKYSHRWNNSPSQRMYDWVDEYNDLKNSNRNDWEEYCKTTGRDRHHDAYDCMA